MAFFFYHVSMQQVGAFHEIGSWPSPDSESPSTLVLDFLASGTEGNQFLLCISYPVHGVLLLQLEWTKTLPPEIPVHLPLLFFSETLLDCGKCHFSFQRP